MQQPAEQSEARPVGSRKTDRRVCADCGRPVVPDQRHLTSGSPAGRGVCDLMTRRP